MPSNRHSKQHLICFLWFVVQPLCFENITTEQIIFILFRFKYIFNRTFLFLSLYMSNNG